MKCILHIGTEKTGTTSFQRWMTVNSESLSVKHIHYAKCLNRPNNNIIHLIAALNYSPSEQFAYLSVFSQQDLDALKKRISVELQNEVAGIQNKNEAVYVISNEHLQSRLNDKADIENLKTLLGKYFSSVEVVLFLRPQAETLLSRLSTASRAGSKVSSDSVKRIEDHFYDYLSLFQRWTAIFDNVTVVPFIKNKDTIQYFCKKFNVNKGDFKSVPRENSALDYRTIAFKNATLLPMVIDSNANKNRQDFTQNLPTTDPLSFGQSEIKYINEFVKNKNEHLCAICPDIKLADLMSEVDKYPEVGNIEKLDNAGIYDPIMSEVVVRMNSELWIERARTQIALTERALANRNLDGAGDFLQKAKKFVGYAGAAHFSSNKAILLRLRNNCKRLTNVLESRKSSK